MIHKSHEILAREITRLEGPHPEHQGPNTLNLTDTSGMPWIGCVPHQPFAIGIVWRKSEALDFLRTLQGLIGLNGFQEFDFYLAKDERRLFANCAIRLVYVETPTGLNKWA